MVFARRGAPDRWRLSTRRRPPRRSPGVVRSWAHRTCAAGGVTWRKGIDPEVLRHGYLVAWDAGDADEARRLLTQLLDVDGRPEFWFDLGLLAKWRRDWAACARANAKALEGDVRLRENPAAWNLGIAATARGDWATARRAWRDYGVDVPDRRGPVEMSLGMIPVRLNPRPQYPGQEPLLLDGVEHSVEVVWARRLSPAHAVLENVPLPDSGHAWGDTVLIDGEPVGERWDGSQWLSVFNELARLATSGAPTWEVRAACPTPDDAQALLHAAAERGVGAEDWTAGFRILCVACSEGRPGGPGHEHGGPAAGWAGSRSFGLAGTPDAVHAALGSWRDAAPGRVHEDAVRLT